MKQRGGKTIFEINEEIDYLARLSGHRREDFRHQLMGANVTIPAEALLGDAVLLLRSLLVILVSDPTAPTISATLGTVPTFPASATSISQATIAMDVTNQRMFVLSGLTPDDVNANMMQVIDIFDRSAPVVVGECPCSVADGNYRAGVTADGLTLAAVNDTISNLAPNSLQLFDLTDPTAPVQLPVFDFTAFALPQSNMAQAVVSGQTLYAASVSNTTDTVYVGIYDLTNPLAVTQLSRPVIDTNAADVIDQSLITVDGDYLYITTRRQSTGVQVLRVWDVSNPAVPVQAASVNLVPDPIGFCGRGSNVDDGVIFLTGGNTTNNDLYTFDVSNPLLPVQVAINTVVAGTRNISMRAAANKLYLNSRNAAPNALNKTLYVYDAANPLALVLLGSVEYANGALGFGQIQQLLLGF